MTTQNDRPAGRRTGRRPGTSESRDTILRAARQRFAEHGYDGVSLRSVAKTAEVDPALVVYFFESKEGLFTAAMRDALPPETLLDEVLAGPVEECGQRLVAAFLQRWETEPTRDKLRSILRSAVSHAASAEVVRGFIAEEVLDPLAKTLGGDNPRVRAGLVGSQLIGLALTRYVIEIDPLAGVDAAHLARVVGPTVQRYLTGELP
ncbi:TetR family transcriptional regulator [Streptomyces sp. NPDC048182]|uniref:TetR/AcrR family transcriptional regulator n=1 Tax=Streptomyces sp. NPDC048182 TaxID=3365507 RepID=UPI003717207A